MSVRRYEIVLLQRERDHMTLDALASRAGCSPALVEACVERGLLEPVEWEGTARMFDDAALPRLLLISRLRRSLGINLAGVAVVLDLLDRVRALQRENEMLHNRF